MKEAKPDWYPLLKTGPFARTTFHMEKILRIEERAAQGSRGRAFPLTKLLPAIGAMVVLAAAIPFLGRLLPEGSLNVPPSGSHSVQEGNDNQIQLIADQKWLVSMETMQRYQAFALDGSGEHLKGVEPLELFQLFMTTSRLGDYPAMYGLLARSPEAGLPDRESFLAYARGSLASRDQIAELWSDWKKNYLLQVDKKGNSATIRLTAVSAASPAVNANIPAQPFELQMTMDSEGIWRISWGSARTFLTSMEKTG
jgi:hypothetical protein